MIIHISIPIKFLKTILSVQSYVNNTCWLEEHIGPTTIFSQYLAAVSHPSLKASPYYPTCFKILGGGVRPR